MASTTPLPTLLRSLNIGARSRVEGEASQNAASTSQSAPKLSLTDQLHLLSAHIDTLEKSILTTVTSAEGSGTIRSQCADAIRLKQRVNDVNSRVRLLEDQTERDNDQEKIDVLENLARYISARKAHEKQKRLQEIAGFIKDALVAIEELEGRIRDGLLDAEGLADTLERVERSASMLGIGPSTAALTENGAVKNPYRWLADGSEASPAVIQNLTTRIERAKEAIKKELLQRWNSCIKIESSQEFISLQVKHESASLSLNQLMQSLHTRAELAPFIDKFASEVITLIIRPLLRSDFICDQYKADDLNWSIKRRLATGGLDASHASLQSVCGLLNLIRSQILSQAPPASQITSNFSTKVVPILIQLLTKKMRSSLPIDLMKPISSGTLPLLATLSQRGIDTYNALLQGGYLHQDLRDEGEELLQWANGIHRHYMKNLATIHRRRARELLLNEAKGGWKAVTVEVDDESEAIQATLMNNASLKKDPEDVINNDVTVEDNGDDIWASWDTEQSTAEATELIRTSSINTGKQRQKKSALGGRRVIKPQDELGSGPFPDDDNRDDVSWGFDDHIGVGERSTTSGASQSQYDALMKGLDEEEDVDEDAWGLTEEEKVQIAAKRASMRGDMTAAFQAKQEKQAEKAPQAVIEQDDEEDKDDAWGLSAQEQEAIKKKRQSMLPPTATFLNFAENSEANNDDVDEDDAWGLNDEERVAIASKRQSVTLPGLVETSKSTEAENSADKSDSFNSQVSDTSTLEYPLQLSGSSLVDVSSELSQDTAMQPSAREDEEDAWGFDGSIIAPVSDMQQHSGPDNTIEVSRRTSMSSDRGDVHTGTPKTSATSSSFTRTLQPLDMDGDESVVVEEQAEREMPEETAEDAWDLRDEVASVSEGAATGDSRGGKNSGSGEKLSDTTTEPWEEVSASAASLPIDEISAPVPTSNAGEWGWTEDNAIPAEVALGSGIGAAATVALQSSTSPSRTRSPHPQISASMQKHQSPRSRHATLRDSKDTSVGRSSSQGRSPAPKFSPPRRKEEVVISQRSIDLIDLIKEILLDIEAISEEGHNETLPPSYLINCINDVLDMHRALLPVGHAETLATVPSLGMQFANDCTFIGKELKEMQPLWTSIKTRLGHSANSIDLDLDKQAQLTTDLGKRSFDGQLLLQHKILLDCLMEARGFASTHEESHFQACQRSLKQVEFVLKQLQSAWKSVLTKSSYLSALGTLVDAVLRKVLMDIEAIEDISEVESEKLASLIKTLGQLEFLFREEGPNQDEQSVVALYVPNWFKASYLIEILTGSLVDIEFLYFEAGALVDYSKAEVISLIRSLFADTPKRSRLVDRIQSS